MRPVAFSGSLPADVTAPERPPESAISCARSGASPAQSFKTFVNDLSADPLVYTGTGRERIQTAVEARCTWLEVGDDFRAWRG